MALTMTTSKNQNYSNYTDDSRFISAEAKLFYSTIFGAQIDQDRPYTISDIKSMELNSTYHEKNITEFSEVINDLMSRDVNLMRDIIIPEWETSSRNFLEKRYEFVNTVFSHAAQGGPTNEPSVKAWQWTDKTEYASQQISLGRDTVIETPSIIHNAMEALAKDASITLVVDSIFSLISIAFDNKLRLDEKLTTAGLTNRTGRNFFAFAKQIDTAWRQIVELMAIEDGLDTLIIPQNTQSYFRKLTGKSRAVMGEKIIYNHETKKPELVNTKEHNSFKTVPTAHGLVDIFELGSLRLNSRDKTPINPLSQRSTIGQFHPGNPNVKADDDVNHVRLDTLDRWIFCQTQATGDEMKFSFKELLRNCFYYDKITGEVSSHVINFAKSKTDSFKKLDLFPGGYRRTPNGLRNADPNKVDTSFDYNTPNPNDPESFRSDFFGVEYRPDTKEFSPPNHIGGFGLNGIPNKWIEKACRSLLLSSQQNNSVNFTEIIDSLISFSEKINSAHCSLAYVEDLIKANSVEENIGSNFFNEFKQNQYGSLNLPEFNPLYPATKYPAGFCRGEHIVTIAETGEEKGWPCAPEAVRIVAGFRLLLKFLTVSIGENDTYNKACSYPWIQQTTDLCALINHFLPFRAPCHLQKANDATKTAGISNDIRFSGYLKCKNGNLRENYFNRVMEHIKKHAGESFVGDFTFQMMDLIFSTFMVSDSATTTQVQRHDLFNTQDDTFGIDHFEDQLKELESNTKELLGEAKFAPDSDFIIGYIGLIKNMINDKKPSVTIDIKKTAKISFEALLADSIGKMRKFTGFSNKNPLKRKALDTTYFRSSIVSSQSIFHFIEANKSKPLIMISDYRTNFTLPIGDFDKFIVSDERILNNNLESKTTSDNEQLLLLKLNRLSISIFQSQASTGNKRPRNGVGKNASMSVFINTGAGGGGGGSGDGGSGFIHQDFASFISSISSNSYLIQFLSGPLLSRVRYAMSMSSLLQRLFFMCIIQAKNNIHIHEKLATIGAQLFEIIVFRPCIEFTSSSMILMKRGVDFAQMAKSKPGFLVSKTASEFIFRCGFRHGIVRQNPDKAFLIENAFPEIFHGGKNNEFMTGPRDLLLPNPHKPANIAVPIPISERTYASPLNLSNAPIKRERSNEREIYGKFSSSEFLVSIFGVETMNIIRDSHAGQPKFCNNVPVALDCHLGPTTYIDHSTLEKIDKAGFGRSGEREMNTPGAELVWNGGGTFFGKKQEKIFNYSRS